MNKELIKKYKKEFDHWLNGGEIYVMFNNGSHRLVDSISDFNKDVKYIILKDCYFPYRKALAEGKTIQQYNTIHTPHKWTDVIYKNTIKFSDNISYRIKPEEPKFKVGDWVTSEMEKPFRILNNNHLNALLLRINDKDKDIPDLELWQPKENEWCWFWWDDGDMLTPALAKFKGTTKDSNNNTIYLCESMFQDYIDDGDLTIQFDSCEPFFGKLPTSLKNQHA